MAGDPWDGDTVVQPAQPTYAAGTPNAGQQVTPAQGAYYRSAGAPSGQGQPGSSAANPSYDTPANAGGDATYHVTTDGRLSAPAGQPGGAINLQPAAGADPWDTDPVLHTSGYEKALAEQRAASAQAGSSPLTAGIDQAGDALLNGFSLNNADRVKGWLAGSGAFLRNLAGDHSISPSDAYAAERDLTREQDTQFAKDHPLANVALEAAGGAPIGVGVGKVVGAAAGPLAEALGTPRWLAGYGLGVPADATVGAAYGAGADKAAPGQGAAQGALVGAGAGVVAPAIGAVGGTLLKAGRDAAGGIVAGVQDALRGKEATLSPAQTASAQQAAARYLAAKLDGAGVTPADIATSPLAGRGATVAEALGPDAVADAAAIIRRPGQGAQLARDTLQPRAEGRTDRLLNDVASITGVRPGTAQQTVEQAVQSGRDAAKPLYDAALSSSAPVVNDNLRQIAMRPAIRRAARAAYDTVLNRGENPEAYGFQRVGGDNPPAQPPSELNGYLTSGDLRLAAPSSESALALRGTTELGAPRDPNQIGPVINARPLDETIPVDSYISLKAPTAKTWDLIKKTAANMVERDPTTGEVIRTGAVGVHNDGLNAASRDLTSALAGTAERPGAIPGYRAALDASGDYLGIQSAYDRAGGHLFGTGAGKQFADFQDLWGSLGNDAERNAVRGRMASDILAKADAGTLTPGKLQAPGVFKKLTTAFGPDAANNLVQAARQEQSLSATGSRLMPGTGSITSDVLNHADAQDQAMDALRTGTHIAHRVAEGKPISAAIAGLTHLAGSARATIKVPYNQATRDELARLYLCGASAFGSTFQPPSQAAGYLAPGALRAWMATGSAGAGATMATRREAQ